MAYVRLERRKRKDVKSLIAKIGHGPTKVKGGFPAGKTGFNVDKALWNNFGTSRGIPPRPFMQDALNNNKAKYKQILRASAKGLLEGVADMNSILSKLGILLASDIQDSITNGSFAPNAPSTIARKGSSKPLIDTGEMRASVTWAVDQ